MRFLKTLFWIVIAVLLTYFSAENWRDVTIALWGNLQADVKLPVLVALAFLLGLVPMWMMHRTRMWRVQNRVTIPHREHVPAPPGAEAEEKE